ncbi:MAG: GNAT family N-acetyltransferase [Sphingorhabdus sp.]
MPLRRLIIETQLANGTPVCLRTIRPSDEDRLREGIRAMSDQSRYQRFFTAFHDPPPAVVRRLSAVDGHDHIGWGAIRSDTEKPLPIGAAHAIRSIDDPKKGELAVALLDDYHGQGLARMLIALVLFDCIEEDMPTLEMEVMATNSAAVRLVQALGARRVDNLDIVDRYILDAASTLERVRSSNPTRALQDIFAVRGSKANSIAFSAPLRDVKTLNIP